VHAQAVARGHQRGRGGYKGEDGGEDGQDIVNKKVTRHARARVNTKKDHHAHEHDEGDVDVPYRRRQAGLVGEVVFGKLLRTRDDIEGASFGKARHGSCLVVVARASGAAIFWPLGKQDERKRQLAAGVTFKERKGVQDSIHAPTLPPRTGRSGWEHVSCVSRVRPTRRPTDSSHRALTALPLSKHESIDGAPCGAPEILGRVALPGRVTSITLSIERHEKREDGTSWRALCRRLRLSITRWDGAGWDWWPTVVEAGPDSARLSVPGCDFLFPCVTPTDCNPRPETLTA